MHGVERVRLVIRTMAGLVAAAVLVAGVTWSAPPAAAAFTVDLTVAAGRVGVVQTVRAVVGSDEVGSPTGRVVFTADDVEIGAQAVGGSSGSTAQVQWTPPKAGPVTLEATFLADSGGQALDRLTVQVATVDTVTTISVPATAAAAAKVTLQATVKSRSGVYSPTGTVAFVTSSGATVATATLGADGKAAAAYTTPATTQTVSVHAVYAGDGNANTSTSANASIKVSATATTLTVTAPTSANVGAPVPLTTKIVPASTTGSIDFSVSGRKLGTSKLVSGAATFTWTPTATGTVTITATFAGGAGVAGSTGTAKVQVGPALAVDTIVVGPQGSATPWSPGTPVSLANGTSVPLSVSSTSRLPVQLAISGPCALAGMTVTVKGVGGNCVLAASTKGGSGFAPASQKYTIQTRLGTQTARIIAPPSGTYARGRSLRLGRLNAVTSVNQPIVWRVTKGASRCSVVQTARFFTVRLRHHGLCRVRASAPGIAGQWAPFTTWRTYRIR